MFYLALFLKVVSKKLLQKGFPKARASKYSSQTPLNDSLTKSLLFPISSNKINQYEQRLMPLSLKFSA
jgi:hypothetical protein